MHPTDSEATSSPTEPASDLRPGEVAVALPVQTDAPPAAGLFSRGATPPPGARRVHAPPGGAGDGPLCTIVVDRRWREALTGLEQHPHLQVLYWMHLSRRDLVLQRPRRERCIKYNTCR